MYVLAVFIALMLASSASSLLRAASPQVSSPAPSSLSTHRALLDQYCVTCHNQRSKTGGLALDALDPARPADHAEVWEKAIRKLRGNLMPPPGARQPDRKAVESLIAYLEGALDQAAAQAPNPGSVALHRLNRAEYGASIKELFDIEIDPAALLPADDVSDGFDNIANVLKVSPSFLDQYISAAREVSIQAVDQPPSTAPVRTTLRAGSLDHSVFAAGGAPLGVQPSIVVDHLFPADGEYEFRGGAIMTVDGARVPTTGRVAVRAGVRRVVVANPVRSFIESEVMLQSFVPGAGGGGFGGRGGGGAGGVQIIGPYNPSGAFIETPSRQRIFVCRPANEADELPCAAEILSNIARRAFRRPVTESDLAAPLEFFKDGRSNGDFEKGIQTGIMAILASPKFLYRVERSPAGLKPGSDYRISDLELASRLSFFLWSQIPDDDLLNLGVKRELSDPAVLERQVRKMLADPRAKSLVTNFAFQWLRVREIDKADPDAILFPNFDPALRQAFRREMELFVESILREDRSVLDLLTADYTYVNERLAAHYGIPDIRGAQFRRVTLTDPNRWGVLGKGAVLTVTSYPNRTSPVLRGAFLLESIIGTPPAAPPPDVEGFKENKEGEKPLTIRAIMEQHRRNPTCNGCHGVIDPLGFALENFDAVGGWRVKDRWAGEVIDASGRLADGTAVGGPDDLRKALLNRPEQFVQTMTEKLMTYALGRTVEYYDMPAVRKIVRDAARGNYRFSSIVLGVVRSAPFQMQRVVEEGN